jgi:hypothetical protein
MDLGVSVSIKLDDNTECRSVEKFGSPTRSYQRFVVDHKEFGVVKIFQTRIQDGVYEVITDISSGALYENNSIDGAIRFKSLKTNVDDRYTLLFQFGKNNTVTDDLEYLRAGGPSLVSRFVAYKKDNRDAKAKAQEVISCKYYTNKGKDTVGLLNLPSYPKELISDVFYTKMQDRTSKAQTALLSGGTGDIFFLPATGAYHAAWEKDGWAVGGEGLHPFFGWLGDDSSNYILLAFMEAIGVAERQDTQCLNSITGFPRSPQSLKTRSGKLPFNIHGGCSLTNRIPYFEQEINSNSWNQGTAPYEDKLNKLQRIDGQHRIREVAATVYLASLGIEWAKERLVGYAYNVMMIVDDWLFNFIQTTPEKDGRFDREHGWDLYTLAAAYRYCDNKDVRKNIQPYLEEYVKATEYTALPNGTTVRNYAVPKKNTNGEIIGWKQRRYWDRDPYNGDPSIPHDIDTTKVLDSVIVATGLYAADIALGKPISWTITALLDFYGTNFIPHQWANKAGPAQICGCAQTAEVRDPIYFKTIEYPLGGPDVNYILWLAGLAYMATENDKYLELGIKATGAVADTFEDKIWEDTRESNSAKVENSAMLLAAKEYYGSNRGLLSIGTSNTFEPIPIPPSEPVISEALVSAHVTRALRGDPTPTAPRPTNYKRKVRGKLDRAISLLEEIDTLLRDPELWKDRS